METDTDYYITYIWIQYSRCMQFLFKTTQISVTGKTQSL